MRTNPNKLITSSQKKDLIKKVKSGVKNYGKNVVGGAKIVGSAVKRKVLKAFKK